MKSKASLVVLLAEIIAIVILHSARSSGPENEQQSISQAQSLSQYEVSAEKQPVLYNTIK
ncbi:MAG TPA: hypothetical protein VD993_02170 [Chitinophagaceae bacterium]|nr:hypothetical protein [Chitinophagaceae bacterium]